MRASIAPADAFRPLDNTMADVLNDIAEETKRASDKFGPQFGISDLEWQSVLLEEVGEAAKNVTKMFVGPVAEDPGVMPADLRAEVVQIAAVAARWVHALDNRP